MDLATILGFSGAFTASTLFFPQVYRAYKTKQTKDLSWVTLYLGLANGLIWTTYGFVKSDLFLFVTNSLLFVAISMLSVLKKKYG